MDSNHPSERARADLLAWREAQPQNFYLQNHQLRRLLDRWISPTDRAAQESGLTHLGAVAAGPLDRAATINNRPGNLPRLERWSPMGERTEEIEHHPSFHDCGRAIYEDGRVISVYGEAQANLNAQARFFLSSHAGEAGHNCPVACTAGVVKAVQSLGTPEMKARWLEGLLASDYDVRLAGAQFLTELQGGSDVGANAVEARPDGEGLGTTRWRIHGEKWFCSSADADLILMTARVQGAESGTRGLGLFLVPRYLEDGSMNGYALRRLKDKVGTRSMVSAEIDFNGAVAYAVGEVAEGFRSTMNLVINTSRLYNSVGCAGLAQRATLVAHGYALHRRAFGEPIISYPLVQEMLAGMGSTSAALLAGGLTLAHLFDEREAGSLSEEDSAFLRVATNLVKMRSCQHAHRVVLTGIETLGGNGAIETFSVMPRLLRDNLVYENWEGTHNTLVAQTHRDFARYGLHEAFLTRVHAMGALGDTDLEEALEPARDAIARAESALESILTCDDAGFAALALRPHAESLGDALLAVALACDVATESPGDRRDRGVDMVRWFSDAFLRASPVERDRSFASRAERIARSL